MKKTNKYLFSILFTATIFLLSGCKSKKVIATTDVKGYKSHMEILENEQKAQLQYQTLSAKGSIEFVKPNTKSSKSVGVVMRIIKDKSILLSFRLFGIEGAKMIISKDSVLIVDRMHKQYLCESIEDLKQKKQIDFNYYNLESMLSNKLFYPGKQEITKNDYSKFMISKANGSYLISTKDASNILYNFAVDGNSHIISTLIYGEGKNHTIQCSYEDFVSDNELTYPTKLGFKLGIKDKRLDVNLSYSKLDINKDFNIDFSVPKNYQKVDLDTVLSILSKKL